MTSFRSPARPSYPGNRKEGEVGTAHPPKPHDAETVKKSVDWSSLHHGPEQHEDQMSRGKGEMDGFGEAGDAHSGLRGPSPKNIGHHPDKHLGGVESRKLRRNWP